MIVKCFTLLNIKYDPLNFEEVAYAPWSVCYHLSPVTKITAIAAGATKRQMNSHTAYMGNTSLPLSVISAFAPSVQNQPTKSEIKIPPRGITMLFVTKSQTSRKSFPAICGKIPPTESAEGIPKRVIAAPINRAAFERLQCI